jgi:hypothetical protein
VFAAAMGISLHQASAMVTFAFADKPGPTNQFIYTAPSGPGELGHLRYASEASVDLVVDDTGEGGAGFTYPDAFFRFGADVGAVFQVGSQPVWIAPLTNGWMDFHEYAGGLLFSGTFGTDLPAALVVVVNVGSIDVSLEVGGLNYIAGSTLLGDLSESIGSPVEGFVPPFDGVWTLSNISDLRTIMCPGEDSRCKDVYFDNFVADSSYSGTAGIRVVPSPGTIALAGLGIAGLACGRRR